MSFRNQNWGLKSMNTNPPPQIHTHNTLIHRRGRIKRRVTRGRIVAHDHSILSI